MTSAYADPVSEVIRAPRGVGMVLRLLDAGWTFGRLRVELPHGAVQTLQGSEPGPSGVLRVRDYRFAARVLGAGDIGFAEGYMAGEWETPDLAALLESLARNYDSIQRLFTGNRIVAAIQWLGHRLHRNSRAGARRNIHAHYDLGNDFYALWLDRTMTYSSARFDRPDEALEAAQTRKYRTLANAMDLRPGQTVLEIGCGWGGFAEFAAREACARVVGLTISRQQYEFARKRLFEQGLADRAEIRLQDYRDVEGRFDRVASIEMFEAVGQEYWSAYFGKIAQVLKPDGVAGLQIITIRDELFERYRRGVDFIQRYIFPGGHLAAEGELRPVIQAHGLVWSGAERFGPDYAETLRRWDERFVAAWDAIARLPGFDTRFRRLWRFYLAYCEAGFRSGRIDVMQLVLRRT